MTYDDVVEETEHALDDAYRLTGDPVYSSVDPRALAGVLLYATREEKKSVAHLFIHEPVRVMHWAETMREDVAA